MILKKNSFAGGNVLSNQRAEIVATLFNKEVATHSSGRNLFFGHCPILFTKVKTSTDDMKILIETG